MVRRRVVCSCFKTETRAHTHTHTQALPCSSSLLGYSRRHQTMEIVVCMLVLARASHDGVHSYGYHLPPRIMSPPPEAHEATQKYSYCCISIYTNITKIQVVVHSKRARNETRSANLRCSPLSYKHFRSGGGSGPAQRDRAEPSLGVGRWSVPAEDHEFSGLVDSCVDFAGNNYTGASSSVRKSPRVFSPGESEGGGERESFYPRLVPERLC